VKPRIPSGDLTLLATSRQHPRWATSDGRRLWVGEGQALVEVQRDVELELRAITVDDRGGVWLVDEHDQLAHVD
jgi:hypothetical protein